MNFTAGELMMYGGIGLFILLLIIFIVLMFVFKRQRNDMIVRIEKEINDE